MPDFKKLLDDRKKEILESLKTLEDEAKPVDLDQPIGRLSRMDAIQQQQMALNSKKQFELTLKQIDQALKKLETGDYGICVSCEEEIDEKRLLAKPETPFCINCQK